MRTIKYRLWDIQAKKMYYLDQMFIGVGQLGFSDDHYIDLTVDDKEDVEIMEWTGLVDRNGKEIYEGDIIKNDGNVGVIKSENWLEIYVEQIKENPEAVCFDDMVRDLYRLEEFEVIGSIYENPELIAQ